MIYRTFVFQNGKLIYDTWYIYGILVGMIEHIQDTAWALISQFLLKVFSISHSAIVRKGHMTMTFRNISDKHGYFETKR
jgi:hypothetical protein